MKVFVSLMAAMAGMVGMAGMSAMAEMSRRSEMLGMAVMTCMLVCLWELKWLLCLYVCMARVSYMAWMAPYSHSVWACINNIRRN